jgi:hypothetical protein
MRTLAGQAVELCWEIEKIPTSKFQTILSIRALDLTTKIKELETDLKLAGEYFNFLQKYETPTTN